MAFRSDSFAPRALITGIQGFTGRYLAKELSADGYEVFGTAHGAESPGANMATVDLCDFEQTRAFVAAVQPQVVVHLAAISFVAHGDVEAIYRVNVLGSRNLLAALAGLPNPPEVVLLVSSGNIYGNIARDYIDESVCAVPANDYAVSKLTMEHMARLWMDRLPIVIVRPFNYTGVGQSLQFVLPKIVDHFRRGERTIELGNIDVERDFSDVRRVVKAYAALLEKKPNREIFNVCSGRAWSLKSVLDMMADIAGYQIAVKVNPAFTRANEVKRLVGSNKKLMACLGELQDISFQETLAWMYHAGKSR